ncbi:MAG: 4-hydroxy-3-methylbut-2-enyl diphosphate reductase [Chloroflexi bacterium]|nr:4-hydroxy-3-methylbut-2-enyl diphosphate reductase [Chloroflexota bacterium]
MSRNNGDNRPEIKLATPSGFCFGVRRALEIARDTLKKARAEKPPLPVYTFGPLVHNPRVIRELREEGIIDMDELSPGKGYLIIRSHGVSPQLRQKAVEMGYDVVDATCPHVKKIHEIVQELTQKGYKIVVIGHPDHPEIMGIVGYASGDYVVVENARDIQGLEKAGKIGVVVQTTARRSQFNEIVDSLLGKAHELRVFDTLCFESQKRQEHLERLAREVDLMLVVGGMNSSNTRRLAEICSTFGTRTIHLEDAGGLSPELLSGVRTVGIASGASTPESDLVEILQCLEKISGE